MMCIQYHLLLSLVSCFSLHQAVSSLPTPIDSICQGATWNRNGITVAGGLGLGSGLNQLYYPNGLFVDDRGIYIADTNNHRVMKWSSGASNGEVIVNGNDQVDGKPLGQLTKVVVDRDENVYVCDRDNKRVLKYRKDEKQGETILKDISCWGLALDNQGSLYVSDLEANLVMKWPDNLIVAGGNGRGNGLNQLSSPYNIFVDTSRTLFIVDRGNNRIMKWLAGAKEGQLAIASKGFGNADDQLYKPMGVTVDGMGSVYVVEYINTRVVRWLDNAQAGKVIIGGPGYGSSPAQLYFPRDVAFDRDGNLYVADTNNNRIQMYTIDKSACVSGSLDRELIHIVKIFFHLA
ncbi:unnamed protein product [Adineta ricciae]|uniref:Uncharacterized protein n=1 Tax=Adineta ricciae TaxID=249248 RepID=A0A815FG43_ADIRI|nr:unnamed protein product [Adineta ricciae]CAF1421536.1 unnamed protein product [Adineta ricciae]